MTFPPPGTTSSNSTHPPASLTLTITSTTMENSTRRPFLPLTLFGPRLQGKTSPFQGKHLPHALDDLVHPMLQSPRLQGKSLLFVLAALVPLTSLPAPTWPIIHCHPPSPGAKHPPPSPTSHITNVIPSPYHPPSPSPQPPLSTALYSKNPGSPSNIPTTASRPLSPVTSMTTMSLALLILGCYMPNAPTLSPQLPAQIGGRTGPMTIS